MFSGFWRRLSGKGNEPVTEATASAPADAPPVASEPAPERADAAPAEASAAPAEAAPRPGFATEASLLRSLNWRCRVLMEGASREAKASDGPALVEGIRTANDSVIRQPPIAAQRALVVAGNPNTPLQEITELFERDPMLAQGLLKTANSIYYRRDGAPITSLYAGVQRIGTKGVQGVLMTSMVQQMLCRPGGSFDALVQRVWSHMQRTAPIARAIAPVFRVDPESAYSLALLHDVGKLVVFDHISRLRHDHRREVRMPEPFLGQLLLHLHEPVGGLAVLRWDLGGEAAHAVAEHHRRPVPSVPDPVTECLFVAEAVELAHANFTKLDWEKIWQAGGITADAVQVQECLATLES